MEKFLKGNVFVATRYINKYGRRRLERRWCAKESTKTLLIDTLWLKELLYDIYLESCRGCSLFLRWGSTQSQVRASSASTWNGVQYNSHRCRKKKTLQKMFHEINFRSLVRLRKFFNNENFPIYGMKPGLMYICQHAHTHTHLPPHTHIQHNLYTHTHAVVRQSPSAVSHSSAVTFTLAQREGMSSSLM